MSLFPNGANDDKAEGQMIAGVVKYYPYYLEQKPCHRLYLLSLSLSHLEVHFLGLFQDNKMW